jgi:two-component sensor histidine kinase/putative methionine-R-sulfoxide reductase with GAF domain
MTDLLAAVGRAESKDELLGELAAIWIRITEADACDILFREANDGLVLKASTQFPEFSERLRLGKGVGLVGQALVENRAVYVAQHAQRDKRFAHYPGVDEQECEAVICLPLNSNGQPLGVLALRKSNPWRPTPAQRAHFEELAGFTAQCVKGFNNAYQIGSQSNRLGALSEVARTISASPYVEEILQLLVNVTAQQFNYRVCTVRLLDENRGELVLRATQAPAKAYARKRAIKLGESIAGRAMDENRPIIVPDVQSAADYIGHDLAVEQGLRSMICVPLTLQDRPIGVMSCYTSEVRAFPPDEIKALETLANQAAVSIEHSKLQVRNTLMQEMHHRVKNNLQQVASLLRLQMRHSSFSTLEEALNDCLGRILAIAAVHDLLSREDLDHVGIVSIAENLVHHHQSSLTLPDKSITFQVRGVDIKLPISQATQIALVLNELLQNAIEHGFVRTPNGEVHINVEEREGEVSVWVSNSGDPLPDGFDPTVVSHLGLKIVDNLARGLGGRFKMSNIFGWTVCEVKFPRATGE